MEIGLGLGSNMGDRLAALRKARDLIRAQAGTLLAAQSPVYETEPVDVPEEFRDRLFLNAVLVIRTPVPVSQLLRLLQVIEQQVGRVPDPVAYRPRPLDLDILYADQLDLQEPHLTVPHLLLTRRRFALQPLCDIRPDLVLPGQLKTVAELLAALDDPHAVTLFARKW